MIGSSRILAGQRAQAPSDASRLLDIEHDTRLLNEQRRVFRGSTTVMTLARLGIISINLTANTVNIELPDDSAITGQTTFTRSNGTVGTVANTTLSADAAGYRVEAAMDQEWRRAA